MLAFLTVIEMTIIPVTLAFVSFILLLALNFCFPWYECMLMLVVSLVSYLVATFILVIFMVAQAVSAFKEIYNIH